ncbi:MAG: hypothetical protein M3300_06485, partial [Actinomycetota bacterium]|nr:hypothetical protein [Actinomycetota bacterium]
ATPVPHHKFVCATHCSRHIYNLPDNTSSPDAHALEFVAVDRQDSRQLHREPSAREHETAQAHHRRKNSPRRTSRAKRPALQRHQARRRGHQF